MTQTKAELLQTRHQGDIRLGDADSSHYVGFKAPATVSSSLVWVLPAADGSASQILKTDGSGNLGWATDSATDSTKMPLAGGIFTGDVTFDGATAGRDIVFDRSDNALEFADNAKATFGSTLSIDTNGTNNNIKGLSGHLNIHIADNKSFSVGNSDFSENILLATQGAGVTLYHSANARVSTSSTGANFTGTDFGFGATPGGTPAGKNVFLAIGDSDTGIVQDGDGQLELWANATEVVNFNAIDGYVSTKPITTTNKVGIGLTGPLLKLHVQDGAVSSATTPNSNCDACIEGTTSTGIQFLADSQIQLRFGSAGSTADGSIIYEHTNDVFRINYSNSGYLSFRDGTAETFRFTPNNELGIAGANYGTSGQVLTSGGSGAAVSWTTIAGGVSSDAQNNTVGGTNAGDSFTGTDAVSNSLFGKDAGTAITSGDQNTGMGHMALLAITTGEANTAFGYAALGTATTAVNNTAIGHTALNICTGVSNTACGHEAGRYPTTGGNNTFVGKGAGYGNSSGTTGASNTAVGALALHVFTSASDNVAIGQSALQSVTSNNNNVAIGYKALEELGQSGASGSGNTAVGRRSARGFRAGSFNTFLGYQAGPYTTTTSTLNYNTCVGNYAGFSLTSGDYNIGVGHDALQHDSPSGAVTTQSGILCLGSDQITDFYCEDTSISSSDKRDKTDIADFTHGLKWINQLKPVTYRWDKRTWYKEYNEDGSIKTEATPDGSKKHNRQHIGFLAQDVLAIEQADGFASKKDDMLVVNINEDETRYGLKYERLVPVLVNAIKELSTEVNTLKTKVAALEAA